MLHFTSYYDRHGVFLIFFFFFLPLAWDKDLENEDTRNKDHGICPVQRHVCTLINWWLFISINSGAAGGSPEVSASGLPLAHQWCHRGDPALEIAISGLTLVSRQKDQKTFGILR